MARTLKIIKTGSGESGVKCPRCDEAIVPIHSEIFDGWNCPECSQTISDAQMKGYVKYLRQLEYGDPDEDYQG